MVGDVVGRFLLVVTSMWLIICCCRFAWSKIDTSTIGVAGVSKPGCITNVFRVRICALCVCGVPRTQTSAAGGIVVSCLPAEAHF